MRQRDVDRLEARTRQLGEDFCLEDIPAAHGQAFWRFAGPQWVRSRPDGRHSMVGPAWLEYPEWLRLPGNGPAKATEDSRAELMRARRTDES